MIKPLTNIITSFLEKRLKIFRNDDGFSLLEIVVATMVSSIVLMMVYSAHRSIMMAVNDVTGIAEFYENVNMAIRRIDKDISCTYYDKYNKKITFIGESDLGEPSNGKVNFITIDRRKYDISGDHKKETHRSDIKEVGYYLKEDTEVQDEKGRRLYYLIKREQNHYDEEPEEGGSTSILLENVLDVKFEFHLRNDWTGEWDSRKYKKIPGGVKTTLKIKNYRGMDEEFVFISHINLKK